MNTADLTLFVRTALTGSITKSAQQLGMTPAAASAGLKRLEHQLGVQLFIRSTRRLRITPEGESYLIHCRRALAELEQGHTLLKQRQSKVAGSVRLSAPSDLGRNLVQPWVDELMDANPELELQLRITDSHSDFYVDQLDLLLRYGEPQDGSSVAFPIITVDRVLCASPDYLKRYGAPQHPEDLHKHNCLLYQLNGQPYTDWRFSDEKGDYHIKVSGNRLSNDADLCRRWAIAGKGLVYKSRLDLAEDISASNLVPLLKEFSTPPLGLWLICPNRAQVTPAVILLRDHLRQKCTKTIRKCEGEPT